MSKIRARILGLDIRKRVKQARELFKGTAGKCIMDVPHEMHDIRMMMRQLADDAEMVLDALETERKS